MSQYQRRNYSKKDDSLKILFCTFNAYTKFNLKELEKKFDEPIKIQPTMWIYMNMMDGWTEEQCDNVAYIVDEISSNNFKFNIAIETNLS